MATLPILVSFASAGAPGLAGALGTLTGALSGPAGVALAAGAAAAAIANMTAMAAAEEKNIAGLRASLAAAGVSYDKNAEDIEGLINKREELAFADDAQRDSLSRLVQMTGSLAEAQNLQAIAMDLARGKNMDLVAASELVGKVAAGNTGILGRYGIVLEEGATATEALDAISARFAGQSEAYAKTATAGWERFNNELGNVQEDIGSALLPVMLELGQAAGDFFQELQDSGALAEVGAALRGVVDVVGLGIDTFKTAAVIYNELTDTIAFGTDAMVKALAGDFVGAMESAGLASDAASRAIDANTAFTERTFERFADTAEASSGEAGDAVATLADRAKAGYGEMGDAADEMTAKVVNDYGTLIAWGQQLADSIEREGDMISRNIERQQQDQDARKAAYEEGQRLAQEYVDGGLSDIISRHEDIGTIEADLADVRAEQVGQAIIDAQALADKQAEEAIRAADVQAREDARAAEVAEREALRAQEAWERAEAQKAADAVTAANEQIRAANAAANANVQAAANARAAWSGGTPGGNAGLMQGGGGFGPGGTQFTGGDAFYWDPNIGGWRGKAPSQGGHYTPRRGDPPLPKWLADEWERSVGTTVHGDIIVNARGSAAEEINALSALVR